jgi:D-alanine-D-alanine ligase
VVVLLGDPRLPNRVKPNGLFDDDDLLAVCELKHALLSIKGYRFVFLDDHSKFAEFLSSNRSRIHMVLNLCDDGFLNDPSMEAHILALLEVLGIRYTGAGPSCSTLCYDRSAVKLLAASIGIPVPWHVLIPEGSEEIPASVRYPVLVDPNFGDNSWGITERSVVRSREELRAASRDLRTYWGYRGPVLVEEFVDGIDLTVSIVGNPPNDVVLPVLTENYSCLPDGLPRVLTYAAKWLPESPYRRVRSAPAEIPDGVRSQVVRWSRALFVRLGCRDYARFDWRLGRDGIPPAPGGQPQPGMGLGRSPEEGLQVPRLELSSDVPRGPRRRREALRRIPQRPKERPRGCTGPLRSFYKNSLGHSLDRRGWLALRTPR